GRDRAAAFKVGAERTKLEFPIVVKRVRLSSRLRGRFFHFDLISPVYRSHVVTRIYACFFPLIVWSYFPDHETTRATSLGSSSGRSPGSPFRMSVVSTH